MSNTKEAVGLVWRTRRDGAQAAYWIARASLVKAGYQPKSVRLHYAADDPALAARCRVLQAEMLAWAAGKMPRSIHYDGTFESLVRFYETHEDSPYHDLGEKTQRSYSKVMALLMKHKGQRRVDAVDASDIRRWYKEIAESNSKGWAYLTINILKSVLSFGATKRIAECRILRVELREAKFQAGGRRKEFLTYPQIIAFRDAARGTRYEWMAVCLLIQFEFGLRRRDVIGEYVTDEIGTDGIRLGKRIWRDGFTWSHLDDHGIFRKLVSKTRFTSEETAVHAISDYPDLAAELSRIPPERRVGPVIIHHKTGRPPTEEQCRRAFRSIARKAGIPDRVWNMDARAGANTEAYEAGATAEETMALLTHTELSTNRDYLREKGKQSHRAAVKRVGSRERKE